MQNNIINDILTNKKINFTYYYYKKNKKDITELLGAGGATTTFNYFKDTVQAYKIAKTIINTGNLCTLKNNDNEKTK